MRIYSLSILIFIFFISCNDNSKLNVRDFEIDVSLDENNKIPTNIISKVEYIPLETNTENIIGKISKLVITDDRIYVLDAHLSKGLFVFDLQGNYLFKIQNFGKGPGEYRELNDCCIFEDKILLLAYKEVLFFDLNGKFLYSHKLKFIAANIAIKNDDEVFLFQNYFLDKNNFVKNHIVKTDLKFQKFDDFFPTYKKEFHDFYRFRSFGNNLLVSAPLFYSNKIFEVSSKNYYEYARFNFLDKNTPDEFLEYSIHSAQKDDYAILRNTIFKKDLVYFLFSYKGYYYIGLHFKNNNTTYTGKKINGVTISNPIIYDIKDDFMYGFVEPLYFLNSAYYNKNSDLEEHNQKLKKLTSKRELTVEDNQIIIRYKINSKFLK